jgi:hypothetical protein
MLPEFYIRPVGEETSVMIQFIAKAVTGVRIPRHLLVSLTEFPFPLLSSSVEPQKPSQLVYIYMRSSQDLFRS